MRHPTWFSRWRSHPFSCAGHVAQGGLAAALILTGDWRLALLGVLWCVGFWLYQGLSFARKVSTEGRGDTAGLDSYDLVVGIGITLAAWGVPRLAAVIQ